VTLKQQNEKNIQDSLGRFDVPGKRRRVVNDQLDKPNYAKQRKRQFERSKGLLRINTYVCWVSLAACQGFKLLHLKNAFYRRS
jgi:hypothetical protein